MKIIRVTAAAIVLSLALTGCVTQNQIAALTQILGTAAASVAQIQGNPDLSAKLTVDTAAAVKAVTEWKSGTNAELAIEALKLVQDDLYLFPQVQPYAALVTLAIGTVQSILILLPAQPTGVATPSFAINLPPAPHAKDAKDFKNQWNAIVAQNPALAPAKIK
jgi:hypothetical protein